jgi:hypothetical protein
LWLSGSMFRKKEKNQKDRGQICQIFLSTKYQNGKNYTKLPQNIPNVHKMDQMSIKWTKCP